MTSLEDLNERTAWLTELKRIRSELKPLSKEEQEMRRPLPPEVLAGALQDTAHIEIGITRLVRPHIHGKEL